MHLFVFSRHFTANERHPTTPPKDLNLPETQIKNVDLQNLLAL